MLAYCLLIEILHDKRAFTTEQIRTMDVVRQLDRLGVFRRSDEWGRLICAGKHGKKKSAPGNEDSGGDSRRQESP